MEVRKQSNGRVLVFVEREGKEIAPIAFELLSAGKKLSIDLKGILCAAVLGNEISDMSSETAHFADEVYSLDHGLLGRFQVEIYVNALEQLCRNFDFDAVLMGHTLDCLDLAPRLAYKMGAEIITDCTNISVEPGTEHLLCTKPVYGAKVFSIFEFERKPFVATLRPKVFDPTGPNPDPGKIIHFNPNMDKSSMRVELIQEFRGESISLDKADAIVAGGRGIKDGDGLRQLQELVIVLKKWFDKVELGASRPLVDLGLVSSLRQVGLTGQKVAPELYIAVGISGSLQHLTGMLGSKKVIAINNNPKAPIFEIAHYGVIGSFEDVVPHFRKKLEEMS